MALLAKLLFRFRKKLKLKWSLRKWNHVESVYVCFLSYEWHFHARPIKCTFSMYCISARASDKFKYVYTLFVIALITCYLGTDNKHTVCATQKIHSTKSNKKKAKMRTSCTGTAAVCRNTKSISRNYSYRDEPRANPTHAYLSQVKKCWTWFPDN